MICEEGLIGLNSHFRFPKSLRCFFFSLQNLPPSGFDNDFFGIDLEEAQAISPSQRWVMEVGYEVGRTGGQPRVGIIHPPLGGAMESWLDQSRFARATHWILYGRLWV